MAKYKFYNVGKANEEITRLEAALAAASKPAEDSVQLAELTATNETISVLLETAQGNLKTENEALEKANAEKTTLASQITTLSTLLRGACDSLKLAVAADAAPGVMIAALENGVASTLAKLGVKPGATPAAKPADAPNGDAKKMTRADFEALTPRARMDFIKAGGTVHE